MGRKWKKWFFFAFSYSESLKKNNLKKSFSGPGDRFLGPFWPSGPKMSIFRKKRFLPVVSPYLPLTSCQKSEKSLEPILRKLWKILKRPIFQKNVKKILSLAQGVCNGSKMKKMIFFWFFLLRITQKKLKKNKKK